MHAERAFERFEALFVVERDGKQDGFHRIVVALIGGGLRVAAGAMEETLERRLVFAAQRAAEFRPVLGGVVNQLHECGNGAAHRNSSPFRNHSRFWVGGQREAAVFLDEARNLARLREELREKRAARRLERSGVGKDGGDERAASQRPQRLERPPERSRGFGFAHVFVEIEVRQRRDDHGARRKFFEQPRDAREQLGHLKAGERARDAHAVVERRRSRRIGRPARAREPRQEQRVEAVRAVEDERRLALRYQARQEVMEEARDVGMAVEDGEAGFRERPEAAAWRRDGIVKSGGQGCRRRGG